MQAVLDCYGLFRDVYTWPGRVQYMTLVCLSIPHSIEMENGTLFPNRKRTINGVDIPLLILGDPAYPALPWLMKPYPEHAHMTRQQRNFNYRQSRARIVVENAFGRLKGRWRCLLKRLDCHVTNVGNIVASCVVLHNLCEMFGDECLTDWVDHSACPPNPPCDAAEGQSSANEIRNAIAQYIHQ